jgi:hypothetical protein
VAKTETLYRAGRRERRAGSGVCSASGFKPRQASGDFVDDDDIDPACGNVNEKTLFL